MTGCAGISFFDWRERSGSHSLITGQMWEKIKITKKCGRAISRYGLSLFVSGWKVETKSGSCTLYQMYSRKCSLV
jgi:hypothetical protein